MLKYQVILHIFLSGYQKLKAQNVDSQSCFCMICSYIRSNMGVITPGISKQKIAYETRISFLVQSIP